MGKLLFLGTGSSTGIPLIACKCKACSSKSKYNKRLRPSALLTKNKKNILIDVGPDIRQQALKYDIRRVDALIITHAHFDHIAGIDDLRVYNRIQKRPIKCYLLKETFEEIKIKYSHFFKKNLKGHTQSARFEFHILDDIKEMFKIGNISFKYFSFYQDSKKVLGIRVDDLAYITDIKRYDSNLLEGLENLDILVLSCLRYKYSEVHFNLKEALTFIKKINPKIVYLTHLAHEVEHFSTSKRLCKNVKLAYDGLEINF